MATRCIQLARQTPVIAFDQPLYVLAKQVHWNWPDRYSEDKFMVIFGGLDISGMLAWKQCLDAVSNRRHISVEVW